MIQPSIWYHSSSLKILRLLHNLSLRIKIIALFLTAIIFVIISQIVAANNLYNKILEERKAKTQDIVSVGYHTVDFFYKKYASGVLSEQEAQRQALATLEQFRYQEDNYIWVQDLRPFVIMHPVNKDLVGADVSDLKDTTGFRFTHALTQTVKAESEGFVTYFWKRSEDTPAVEKVSFAKLFIPWGWTIATGIYIDDVNETYLSTAIITFLEVVFVLIGLLVCLSTITGSILTPIRTLNAAMSKVTKEKEFVPAIIYPPQDELGDIIRSFNAMQKELATAFYDLNEANQAKTRFMAKMSHEIRTPLNGIKGNMQLLLQEPDFSDQAKQQLAFVLRSGDFLTQLLNDILDISSIESHTLKLSEKPFDVKQELNDVLRHFAPEIRNKGLKMSLTFELENQIRIGDPIRIKQILFNTISNAVKYTARGVIEIKITEATGYEGVNICIADSGIGIEKKQLNKLKEALENADLSSTDIANDIGLGLTIVGLLAAKMKGTLDISSEANFGTKVSCVLPLAIVNESVLSRASDNHSIQNATLTNCKVLVAEDNPINQEIIESLLTSSGIKVVMADNGQLAVEAMNESFDAVLMDIQMPVMDGIQACQIIKERHSTIPIAALTANLMPAEIKAYEEAGFDQIIGKPYDINEISAFLLQQLKRKDSNKT